MGCYWALEIWKLLFFTSGDFSSITSFIFSFCPFVSVCTGDQTSSTDSLILSFLNFPFLYFLFHLILKILLKFCLSYFLGIGFFYFSLQERVSIAGLMLLSLGGFEDNSWDLASGMYSMLLSDKVVLCAWGTEFCSISLPRLFVWMI